MGGGNGKDGATGVDVLLSNCRSAPIEIVESEFPIRIVRFDLLQDSGGPGKYRGGLGFMREYEILEDYERFSSRNDRHAVPPRGIKGGKDGRVGSIIINPGTDHEKRLPARFADFILRKGDIVRAERPGGGGFGTPFDRSGGFPGKEKKMKANGGNYGTVLHCSFCGKSQDEVRKLIAGPTVYICDECIELCNDIIAERARTDAFRGARPCPSPLK